jgi:hypothetical protein
MSVPKFVKKMDYERCYTEKGDYAEKKFILKEKKFEKKRKDFNLETALRINNSEDLVYNYTGRNIFGRGDSKEHKRACRRAGKRIIPFGIGLTAATFLLPVVGGPSLWLTTWLCGGTTLSFTLLELVTLGGHRGPFSFLLYGQFLKEEREKILGGLAKEADKLYLKNQISSTYSGSDLENKKSVVDLKKGIKDGIQYVQRNSGELLDISEESLKESFNGIFNYLSKFNGIYVKTNCRGKKAYERTFDFYGKVLSLDKASSFELKKSIDYISKELGKANKNN